MKCNLPHILMITFAFLSCKKEDKKDLPAENHYFNCNIDGAEKSIVNTRQPYYYLYHDSLSVSGGLIPDNAEYPSMSMQITFNRTPTRTDILDMKGTKVYFSNKTEKKLHFEYREQNAFFRSDTSSDSAFNFYFTDISFTETSTSPSGEDVIDVFTVTGECSALCAKGFSFTKLTNGKFKFLLIRKTNW